MKPENYELHHCERCGIEVDGPSQLHTHEQWTRLCGTCFKGLTTFKALKNAGFGKKTTELTAEELIQRIWDVSATSKSPGGMVGEIRELIREWRHS